MSYGFGLKFWTAAKQASWIIEKNGRRKVIKHIECVKLHILNSISKVKDLRVSIEW